MHIWRVPAGAVCLKVCQVRQIQRFSTGDLGVTEAVQPRSHRFAVCRLIADARSLSRWQVADYPAPRLFVEGECLDDFVAFEKQDLCGFLRVHRVEPLWNRRLFYQSCHHLPPRCVDGVELVVTSLPEVVARLVGREVAHFYC